MGYRCPICLKDFQREKEKWEEHCKEAHGGVGNDIIQAVLLLEKINFPKEEEKDGKN